MEREDIERTDTEGMEQRIRCKGEQKKLKINVEFWIIPLNKSINFDSIYFKFQKSSV